MLWSFHRVVLPVAGEQADDGGGGGGEGGEEGGVERKGECGQNVPGRVEGKKSSRPRQREASGVREEEGGPWSFNEPI